MTDTTELRRAFRSALDAAHPITHADPLMLHEVERAGYALFHALDAEDAEREKRRHVVDIVREANTPDAHAHYKAARENDKQ